MSLSKAIASRQLTGKRQATKKQGGKKAAKLLLAKGNRLYNEVDREVRFLNRRIDNYEFEHNLDVQLSGIPVNPIGNSRQDWESRDLARYKRRRDERNEYLQFVHEKRVKLNKVIKGEETWDDALWKPLPIQRPNVFNWTHQDPVGPHPSSTFRTVPIESQGELNWLGDTGIHGRPYT